MGLFTWQAGRWLTACWWMTRIWMLFFKIHYHTAAVDCSGNASVEVIQHLQGGQFELLFCSTPCLRKFLMEMVNKLEVAITKAAKG
jgi:hypothetical protein